MLAAKKAQYSLPAHLRAVLPDLAVSDSSFDVGSASAANADSTQTKQDSKGSWNQRVMVIGRVSEGTAQGKPWFAMDVIVLDHPSSDGACEIVDNERATIDRAGITLTAEAIFNVKVQAGSGARWESYDIPDQMQTIRKGSIYHVSIFGKRPTIRAAGVERQLRFGDVIYLKGVTCKYKRGKFAEALGRHRYFTNFSASAIEFRTTLEDSGVNETALWMTMLSYQPQEAEHFYPMIKNANLDHAAILQRQKEKLAKKEEEEKKKAASGAVVPAAAKPAAAAVDADAVVSAQALLNEAGVVGKFRPSRSDNRDIGDEVLVEESREWKGRNFERFIPLVDMAPQLLAYREAMGLPYSFWKTIGGFDAAAEHCFEFTRRVTDEDKKNGVTQHDPEPRWHFGRNCIQVKPSAGEDQYRDSTVKCDVTCWKDALLHTGIANTEHQRKLWPFMAEGAVGFVRTFIRGPESADKTDQTSKDPLKEMFFMLNNASKKGEKVQSIHLFHAATILNTCWEVTAECAGDLLEHLSGQEEFADRVQRNMSRIDDSTHAQANPLNQARKKRVINVLECDKDIVGDKERYRFFVLCNRSKKTAMSVIGGRLAELEHSERVQQMSQHLYALATNNAEGLVFDTTAFHPFRDDLPFEFTIFALAIDYLKDLGFSDYFGTDVYGDLMVPQEDYLLEWTQTAAQVRAEEAELRKKAEEERKRLEEEEAKKAKALAEEEKKKQEAAAAAAKSPSAKPAAAAAAKPPAKPAAPKAKAAAAAVPKLVEPPAKPAAPKAKAAPPPPPKKVVEEEQPDAEMSEVTAGQQQEEEPHAWQEMDDEFVEDEPAPPPKPSPKKSAAKPAAAAASLKRAKSAEEEEQPQGEDEEEHNAEEGEEEQPTPPPAPVTSKRAKTAATNKK